MKNALLKLRSLEPTMSNAEANIAKYIQNNPEKVCTLTVRQLAEYSYSSPSSVIRVCRSIGFKGFREFREALILELAILGREYNHAENDVLMGDSMDAIIDKITHNNIRSLEDTQHLLDVETLIECVDLLLKSRSILFFGMGSSLCVAKDTYLKFLRLGKPCTVNEDWHSQLLQARNSSPEDLAIIISYSGKTKEMIECLDALKKNSTPVIAITRYAPSPIAKGADYRLYTAANETLFRNGAMSSRLSQLNVLDILYTGFTFKQHDYSMKQLVHTHIQKEEPFSAESFRKQTDLNQVGGGD